jgi:FkbM family methyltransferase
MIRHVTRLSKAIRVLGTLSGVMVYYYYFYHRLIKSKRWAAREVRLRSVSRPIWLRPGVSDWIAMERIFLDREYDPVSDVHQRALADSATRLAASGAKPLIIDCGANIGLSSVWFAEQFPDAVVIAVEPEPRNFEILTRNARNFPTIIPVNAAISDCASRITLVNPTKVPWAWQTQESNSGETEAVSVVQLIARQKNARLLMVKVDIEGFETALLRSDTSWVDSVPLLVFEMHDWMMPWSGSGHAFFSVLSRTKRDYLIKGENVFAYSHSLCQALSDAAE